jgi:hypothetical protein
MGFSVSDLTSVFSRPKAAPTSASTNTVTADTQTLINDMENIYGSEPQNWYTAKPYGFRMTLRNGSQFVFFLPINPSNINITTHFATNIIPTLYGTVEEHSDVRYYDITIEGNTSMAPRYIKPVQVAKDTDISQADATLRRSGRSRVSISQGASLGGFFSQTLAVFNKVKNQATELLSGAPKPKAAFYADNSGYSAFHNFYRFLLRHKKDASGADGKQGQRTSHPLTFFNYKDNNMYDAVIRNFTLRKSAENPMLYYYNIQIRAYNLRSISNNSQENNDMKQRLADLGLNGVDGSSVLGDIKSLSSQAKSIVGSAVGGVNVLGR